MAKKAAETPEVRGLMEQAGKLLDQITPQIDEVRALLKAHGYVLEIKTDVEGKYIFNIQPPKA